MPKEEAKAGWKRTAGTGKDNNRNGGEEMGGVYEREKGGAGKRKQNRGHSPKTKNHSC